MAPDVDGEKCYDRVRHLAHELLGRIVFVTGDAFTARARAFLGRIDNVVLDKPVRSGELREAVAQLIGSVSTGDPRP